VAEATVPDGEENTAPRLCSLLFFLSEGVPTLPSLYTCHPAYNKINQKKVNPFFPLPSVELKVAHSCSILICGIVHYFSIEVMTF